MADQTISGKPDRSPEEVGTASKRRRLSGKSLRAALVLTVVGVLGGAGTWYLTYRPSAPPKERLRLALELLRQTDSLRAVKKAQQIAEELEALEYRDPDFAGAIEFILGIAAFRQAERKAQAYQEPEYVKAVSYLRKAEQRALHESWRPQWAYALGVSLLKIGSPNEARPLLEEAAQNHPPGNVDASILLTDIYLDLNTQPEIEKALRLNESVIDQTGLDPIDRDRAYLQRAQILQLLGRKDEAQTALEQVSQEANKQRSSILINAQTLMAEGHYAQALKLLEPLADAAVLDGYYTRQALFRMGLCSEKLAEVAAQPDERKLRIDVAINNYERTSQKFPNSHESLAANLRVADLFRTYKPTPRNEEALERYRQALRCVRRVKDFRNRWVSIEGFRKTILHAWDAWIRTHAYQEAIALAGFAEPLLSRITALELAARANQRWAEHLQQQFQQASAAKRPDIQTILRSRWRASGRTFAQLAAEVRVTSEYPDWLWTSADFYYRGQDYPRALTQLEKFIALQQRNLLPAATVRQGEILMHLGRYDEALSSFQKVLDQYRTDPAFFKAQYVIGQCFLEKNDPASAEQAWRAVLASETLTPAAEEWRLALFALGRLLYRRAEFMPPKNDRNPTSDRTSQLASDGDDELALWDETIIRFNEYLQRYPESPEAEEVSYLQAEGLTRSAGILRVRLDSAETENAQFELRQQIDRRLDAALTQFQNLQAVLVEKQRQDQLDALGHRELRDTYFEIARVLFELEQFDRAIAAYRSATYKYPDDPQVLLAYIQMAHCFSRLGKAAEARSLLEQAKVIFKDLPKTVFQSSTTSMQAEDWEQWIEWAGQMHKFVEADSVTTTQLE